MIDLLYFRQFKNLRGIGHFITTRSGGVSQESYNSLNLSLKSGDKESSVRENRRILAEQIGLSADAMLFPDQCHTRNIERIESKFELKELSETDGIITHQKGICLCVLAADCVPILLYDPVKQIVGAVHSGWKGTVAGIITNAIEQMVEYYQSNPGRIMAGIGPAISANNYKVGDEVSDEFREIFGNEKDIVSPNPVTGHDHLDLQGANRLLLLRAGLSAKRIEVMKTCTFANPKLFFSARRDGYETGRFAAGIYLRE